MILCPHCDTMMNPLWERDSYLNYHGTEISFSQAVCSECSKDLSLNTKDDEEHEPIQGR